MFPGPDGPLQAKFDTPGISSSPMKFVADPILPKVSISFETTNRITINSEFVEL